MHPNGTILTFTFRFKILLQGRLHRHPPCPCAGCWRLRLVHQPRRRQVGQKNVFWKNYQNRSHRSSFCVFIVKNHPFWCVFFNLSRKLKFAPRYTVKRVGDSLGAPEGTTTRVAGAWASRKLISNLIESESKQYLNQRFRHEHNLISAKNKLTRVVLRRNIKLYQQLKYWK